ncbi:MAG: heme exporter protein CcmD [Gammaproteobacteria bacterium]|nr:heme exporter protein CcmD [Gammaproteobacteria bacterium]
MAEFLAMGGYAFFVWGAYGLVAVVLIGNAAVPWWWHQRLKRKPSGRL